MNTFASTRTTNKYNELGLRLRKSNKTWNLTKNIGKGGRAAIFKSKAITVNTASLLARIGTTKGLVRFPMKDKIISMFTKYSK